MKINFWKVFKFAAIFIALLVVGFIVYIISQIGVQQGNILNVEPNTSWISDKNNKILYLQNYALYSILLNGSNKELILSNTDGVIFSSDRKKILYSEYNKKIGNLLIKDLENSQTDIIASWPYHSVFFSPDEKKVVYLSDDSAHSRKLNFYDIDTKTKKIINLPEKDTSLIRFTLDKNEIVFEGEYINSSIPQKCYRYDMKTGELKESLLRNKSKGPVSNICIRDEDSYVNEGEIALGNLWMAGGLSDVSPDGQTEAYSKEGSLWLKTKNSDDLLVKFDGGYVPGYNSGAHQSGWSPDGKYILFYFNKSFYIYDLENKKAGFLTLGNVARFDFIKK